MYIPPILSQKSTRGCVLTKQERGNKQTNKKTFVSGNRGSNPVETKKQKEYSRQGREIPGYQLCTGINGKQSRLEEYHSRDRHSRVLII